MIGGIETGSTKTWSELQNWRVLGLDKSNFLGYLLGSMWN